MTMMPEMDSNVQAVQRLLASRAEEGLKKYGVTTEREDLSFLDWAQHAQEEALDFAVYLQRMKSFFCGFMTFRLGDEVRKTKGSQWQGKVVGWYSTKLTPEGYAVESNTEKGSVQIYPVSALVRVENPS